MGSRLDRITDWEDLAYRARYRVEGMARILAVSRHTLHSHLTAVVGCSPRQWIGDLRLRRAGDLLSRGRACKEIAHELGLTPASLCRLFHRTAGSAPREYALAMSSKGFRRLEQLTQGAPQTCTNPQLLQAAVA